MPHPVNSLQIAPNSDAETSAVFSDHEIIQRVLAGDRPIFELILRRYNQRLFRIARSIIGDDIEAEDVVQETYFRAYRNLGRYAGRASFATWLTRIAVNESISRRRNRRRTPVLDMSAPEFEPASMKSHDDNASENEASREELRKVLQYAIDALPTKLRVVFVMRFVERLSTLEVARCLDLSPSNVKVRLHRARAELRTSIDARIGAECRKLFMFDGERCNRIVKSVMSRICDGS